MRRKTLRLTVSEQEWLNAYREALTARFSGKVEEVVIYGSKARGDSGPDSDLDVLLIVADKAEDLKWPMRRVGYLLAATSDAVPSIMAYTRAAWDRLAESGSPYRRNVERDGIRVL